MDFQSFNGSTALLEALLCWALRKCRNDGIDPLEMLGRWLEKGEFIETVAPHRRKLDARRFVYRANNPSLATTLRNLRTRAPSLFDGDAALSEQASAHVLIAAASLVQPVAHAHMIGCSQCPADAGRHAAQLQVAAFDISILLLHWMSCGVLLPLSTKGLA